MTFQSQSEKYQLMIKGLVGRIDGATASNRQAFRRKQDSKKAVQQGLIEVDRRDRIREDSSV